MRGGAQSWCGSQEGMAEAAGPAVAPDPWGLEESGADSRQGVQTATGEGAAEGAQPVDQDPSADCRAHEAVEECGEGKEETLEKED